MTQIQQLLNLIDTWRVNRALLASKMTMPTGTFNNKLNPNHSASFTDKEVNQLCNILIEFRDDLGIVESADFNDAIKMMSEK